MKSLGIAALVLLAGCDLYFNDGDDDCTFIGVPEIAANQYRNPDTGVCESFGGTCNDTCGACDLAEPQQPFPDWGSCFSECEFLDETTCIATSGCLVAYTNDAITDGPPAFRGCWQTAQSGPIQGGGCAGLGSYECTRHDDCSAVYNDQLGPNDSVISSQFGACIAEKGVSTCTNIDCGPGSHCEEHCTTGPDDSPECRPACVPDQNACSGTTCPTGFECVETCDGQDPNNPGCGVCTVECVPLGTCEGLTTEAACTARSDCTAVYEGTNCTCTQDGACECEILTYDHCES